MQKLRNMTSLYLCCGEKILLLYRQGSDVINNIWIGSAGGHFEENELNAPYTCILRELNEELNISENMIENLSLRYITLRQVKDEIRQTYYFFAELKNSDNIELSSNEGILKWFSTDELKELDMPLTAKYVIEHWLSKGKDTAEIYVGIATDSNVKFSELFKS